MLRVGGGLERLSLSSDNALGSRCVFSVDCIIMFSFPHFSQVFILPGGWERGARGRERGDKMLSLRLRVTAAPRVSSV